MLPDTLGTVAATETTGAALQLQLLGPPKLYRAGLGVNLGTRKAMALVAYLAYERTPASRHELDALLWPELDDARARRNLRGEISRVNRTLGWELLQSSEQTVGLNPHGFDVDVWRLEDAIEQGDFERGVALYSGSLLEGFYIRDAETFESWLEDSRSALREKVIAALDALCEATEQVEDYAHGLNYAHRVIELDPLAENAYLRAMRFAALFGDRVEVLKLYRDLETMLAEEFQLEPDDQVQAFAEQLAAGLDRSPAVQSLVSIPLPGPRGDDAPRPPAATLAPGVRHNLPVSPTPFVGRRRELENIAAHLALPECRLLTLVGLGGTGKTRLALEAAARQVERFRDGVWFVPLTARATIEVIFYAIASALNLEYGSETNPREPVLAHLRDKELLLLLDNAEHLLADVESLQDLLKGAPGLKILVTSRKSLDLRGEYIFDVEGLPLTERAGLPYQEPGDAVTLFVGAASRADAGFTFTRENADCIGRICARVDGLPLGIELAAAQLRTLSCEELELELEKSYASLVSDYRDAPERHRSLRLVFEQTWDTLAAEHQSAYRALSVFRNAFSKDEAHLIAGVPLPVLSELVERSLLRRRALGSYQLLESMRQFAAEKLDQLPEQKQQIMAAHREYYAVAGD